MIDQYNLICSKPDSKWLPIKKKGSAFSAQIKNDTPDQVDQGETTAPTQPNSQAPAVTLEQVRELICAAQAGPTPTTPAPAPAPQQDTGVTPRAHAFRARPVIDRNPPKQGEAHSRLNPETGREEFWCSTCPNGGRWGNHLTTGHKAWLKEYMEFKAKQRGETAPAATASNNDNPTSTAPQASSEAPGSMKKEAPEAAKIASILKRDYVSFQDSSDDESL